MLYKHIHTHTHPWQKLFFHLLVVPQENNKRWNTGAVLVSTPNAPHRQSASLGRQRIFQKEMAIGFQRHRVHWTIGESREQSSRVFFERGTLVEVGWRRTWCVCLPRISINVQACIFAIFYTSFIPCTYIKHK